MFARRRLQSVGYWCQLPGAPPPEKDRYPDPRRLVQPGWRSAERPLILAYLRSRWTYAQWRGHSYCRFRCGAADGEMGSRCLTDGIWVWPEGLPHYVERHDVYLPAKFIRTMIRRGWRIPRRWRLPTRTTHGEPDDTFWIAWGAKEAAARGADHGAARKPGDGARLR